MKTISKNLKTLLFSLLFISILVFSSVLLVGCGENKVEKDVTKLNGIIESVKETTITDGGQYTGLDIIFLTDPTSITATYNDAVIESEKTTIEDYSNNGLVVTAYSYAFTFDAIDKDTYNSSPIHVNVVIAEKEYEFDLTTNLIERIYPSLAQ